MKHWNKRRKNVKIKISSHSFIKDNNYHYSASKDLCGDYMSKALSIILHPLSMYVPSHPHARSQESKIFGRVFLPLNASGRIFRL